MLLKMIAKAVCLDHFPVGIGWSDEDDVWELYDLGECPEHLTPHFLLLSPKQPPITLTEDAEILSDILNIQVREGLTP